MNEQDRETIKLIAGICGNIAAIAVGIALFERNPSGMLVAAIFGIMAISTIRSLR
ncbi:hypothetical protein [uncultured Desulfovibrio sp.]|uniref:hypothetical protein n=1 Tax=uncultured Desulfovibrio sp. TaxID=167968 RepID=UPI0003B58045|nr:hypothetical protein [uncultured Desulfovibrio sp.]